FDTTTESGILPLKSPGNECGEAPGLILQVAEALEVPDPMLNLVTYSKHHRRRRPQPDMMRGPPNSQPLICSAFRSNALAHFIIQNLRAATGHTIQTRLLQTRHNRFIIEPRDKMDVVYLR